MHTSKALWMAGIFVFVAALIGPAQACDKSGAKASTDIGQASTSQVSATCTKAGGVSSAQAGAAGCASTRGAGGVKQAQASMCSRNVEECAQTMRTEYATRGWLGVELHWNDGVAEPTVSAVVPGSPADQAGFRAGDVMTSMSGISFAPAQRAVFSDFMANAYTIGKTVRYTVLRGSEIVRLNPKLAKIPREQLDRMVAMHVSSRHPADVASVVN